MAFAATSIKNLKPSRGATQNDTIGEVFTRSFSFVIPAGSTATTSELTNVKLPANCVILGAYLKSDTTSTANSTLALSATTGGAVFAAAAALTAANATVTWYSKTVTTPLATAGGDSTVTATIGTATEANAVAVTCTVVGMVIDPVVPTYTTFTI